MITSQTRASLFPAIRDASAIRMTESINAETLSLAGESAGVVSPGAPSPPVALAAVVCAGGGICTSEPHAAAKADSSSAQRVPEMLIVIRNIAIR
jgi:hypothetical protein